MLISKKMMSNCRVRAYSIYLKETYTIQIKEQLFWYNIYYQYSNKADIEKAILKYKDPNVACLYDRAPAHKQIVLALKERTGFSSKLIDNKLVQKETHDDLHYRSCQF